MNVLAINGSPRKNWNTATLLNLALEGAKEQGAETELVHLYNLSYKGCISCFACKKRGGSSYGRCAVQDDLTPLLKKMEDVDALILGSPIYFGSATGEMRSFLERLLFPYLAYTDPPQKIFPKTIKTGFIYTMNVPEESMNEWGYPQNFKRTEMTLQRIFGSSETLVSCDTYQFHDYALYVADRFDPGKKAERREKIFPLDCKKAFDMGTQFARNGK
ncbi:MAG: flavodoxin family protein [Nitrospirota bacterium]